MTDERHILVVDDDKRLRSLLQGFLAREGYRVSASPNAAAARALLQGLSFDAIILDVMMPGEDGLSFVKHLREVKDDVPVLMLSALSESADRIEGLAKGSDDYLAKPFEPQELLLRLKNLLRRAKVEPEPQNEAVFGRFTFNLVSGELQRDGAPVRLTSKERDMLRQLAKAEGKAVTRDALSGHGGAAASRKVDVQINRLRQKLEEDPANPRYLQTLRGQGYALFAGR